MPVRLLSPGVAVGLALLAPVASAAAQCGSGGSCFADHGPGCDNADCCAAICAVDGFCCAVQWDGTCVVEANEVCVSHAIAGPFINPANQHRYYIFDEGTWQTIKEAAASVGGYLVSIQSSGENQWVTQTVQSAGFPTDFFIGLSDLAVEGQFVWANGATSAYFDWDVGQPDNFGPGEDVVQIWNASGKWNDLPATFVRFGVVEVEATSCGDPAAGSCFEIHGRFCDDQGCCEAICAFDPFCCSISWDGLCVGKAILGCSVEPLAGPMVDPNTGRLVTLLTPGYWPAERDAAEALGGRLATVDDGRTNEFIRRWMIDGQPVASPAGVWLGASDAEREGTFAWESGAPFQYHHWAPGEPNNASNEDYVGMLKLFGVWNDFGIATIQRGVMDTTLPACGDGTGDCFLSHVGTGCGVESCCNSVCRVDPFCCAVAWDGICANDAGALCTPDVVSGPIVRPSTRRAYYVLSETTWAEAERWANAIGGHLAVPSDAAEQAWLVANVLPAVGPNAFALTGVTDQLKEGFYQAIDNPNAVFFSTWGPGQPDNAPDSDVVGIAANGNWNDVPVFSLAKALIEVPCVGDLDGDGAVGGADLAIVLGSWGTFQGPPDMNMDGQVDGADLAILLGAWGPCLTSDCCGAHGGPGCDQPGCTSCVCSLDPFCCQALWDAACAGETGGPCAGVCQCPG